MARPFMHLTAALRYTVDSFDRLCWRRHQNEERTMRLSVVDAERCTGCEICMFACTRRLGYAGMGKTAIGIKSLGGMERGLSVVVCRCARAAASC
jgi:Fe-S-cluster-containing dehydrogenase component